MNKEQKELTQLIITMVVFGIFAVTCWIAGIMGHYHHFFWAVVTTLITVVAYLDYRIKKRL